MPLARRDRLAQLDLRVRRAVRELPGLRAQLDLKARLVLRAPRVLLVAQDLRVPKARKEALGSLVRLVPQDR